ncbi:FAD/NAD(P)-binding domain-containing protein [Pseudovirgaria hyperparasitica]|uniref:FAD/NAD(P)-binding domain-containing protein n=1 Tax=Pseudovirgaria hyperparasitica TaxID=470096 RepID=A0A6A6W3A9_9PEZI|nr:FAD/NAD(P)-binding domain-containing protein [Pseudovirgaria hyperparasitica]KAF2756619.1 FAD/NAD(P)-binding domain-containing protein [Pseudovirgaria hyperparasitica]
MEGIGEKSPERFKSGYQIAVIGAGLVGLALSISLRKFGYNVTIFESDVELKEVGAGIVLPPNSTRVLHTLGLLEAVRSRSSASHYWVSHSYRAQPSNTHDGVADPNPLAALSLEPDMEQQYGSPFLVIHRADLRKILYSAAQSAGVKIHLGANVDISRTNFTTGSICTTTPTNDTIYHTADLLFAADGQASSTRTFLNTQPITPRWSGLIVTRVLMSVSDMHALGMSSLISPPSVHIWQGPHTMATGYLLKDDFYLALTTDVSASPHAAAIHESLFRGPRPASKAELLALYSAPWDPRIRTLIEHGTGFLKWLVLDYHADVSVPRSWARAREGERLAVALVGDAAHAMKPFLGSGAAMGFEDASLLSNLLGYSSSVVEVRRALALFERERRPRTRFVGRMTDKMGAIWTLPDGKEQEDRDRTYRREGGVGVTGRETCGFPNALQDPGFQGWLYSFDGRVEAERLLRRESMDSQL